MFLGRSSWTDTSVLIELGQNHSSGRSDLDCGTGRKVRASMESCGKSFALLEYCPDEHCVESVPIRLLDREAQQVGNVPPPARSGACLMDVVT